MKGFMRGFKVMGRRGGEKEDPLGKMGGYLQR